MTPEQQSEAGKLIILEMADGGVKWAAHFFEVPGGLVFADTNWSDPLNWSHPLHFVECKVHGFNYTTPDGQTLEIYTEDPPEGFDFGDRQLCRERIRELFGV